MNSAAMNGNDFYLKQLEPLVGGKIDSVVSDPEGEFFGLQIVTKGRKTILWFLRDDEGNGPGSFEVSDVDVVVRHAEAS